MNEGYAHIFYKNKETSRLWCDLDPKHLSSSKFLHVGCLKMILEAPLWIIMLWWLLWRHSISKFVRNPTLHMFGVCSWNVSQKHWAIQVSPTRKFWDLCDEMSKKGFLFPLYFLSTYVFFLCLVNSPIHH